MNGGGVETTNIKKYYRPRNYANTQCKDLSIILGNKELCDPLSSSARSNRYPIYYVSTIECLDGRFVNTF